MQNHECSCRCHQGHSILHRLSCCFVCEKCGKNIQAGYLQKHKEECLKKEISKTEEFMTWFEKYHPIKKYWDMAQENSQESYPYENFRKIFLGKLVDLLDIPKTVHILNSVDETCFVAAFSTKEKAEKAKKVLDPSEGVLEIFSEPLDPEYEIPKGKSIYYIFMTKEGEVNTCLTNDSTYWLCCRTEDAMKNRYCFSSFSQDLDSFCFWCFAESREDAILQVNTFRKELLDKGEWGIQPQGDRHYD